MFFMGERETDYLCPASIKAIDRDCNVLLLEVELRPQRNGGRLVHSKSFAINHLDKELSRKICPTDGVGISKSQRILGQNASSVPFSRLAFVDRRKLIEIVTSQVRVKVPDSANSLLFSPLRTDGDGFQQDVAHLHERRSDLMQLYKLGEDRNDWKEFSELPADPTQLDLGDIRRSLDQPTGRTQSSKRKSLAGYFRESIKLITGKSSSKSMSGCCESSKIYSSNSENKYAQLHEFLHSGDTIGLTLHASKVSLSSYRAWPNMHETRFALYKLPMKVSVAGQEYAGLWGGTFGWPPGRPSADKPGKALFFLLLSYEEPQKGKRLLIATKILEGTRYVLHPNGSAMFIVNIDDPSLEPFPWNTDGDSLSFDLKYTFVGEGIAN